ncbi:diguanylate cyclase [Parazoarcus communis]|uniref:Diguanylate cyclase n=1 Tax=Parazoarcus communis TaxID=41977 RepID=A0A2U8GWW5_9RHOO|nr:EAL domain-containing protein [Parazoarcus communis]AWI77486.1 diguanylate cyclase [Parazoarcus communis]
MPPLTGLVALYGQEIVWAARMACDEINERGGVLGRPLELVIEDDGSLPDTAVPAALRLVNEHRCAAIIGNLLSNSRIAVAEQVAEPLHMPYLNFSFYEGSISGRYFFHIAALPNQQIEKMIPFMARRYGLKMFFAGNNYEWPRGSIDAAKRTLKGIEGDCLGEEYLSIGASDDEIRRLLEMVARSGADVFVPYFAGNDQIRLLTFFAAMGLSKRMAVVMGHFDEMMASCLPPEVREGLYSSNTYFMSLDSAENHRYLQRLAREPDINGIWPEGNGILTNFGEGAYLCVHAFAEAAEAAGTVEAEALVDALERVRITGPQGRVDMDAATHHAVVNTYLARCTSRGDFEITEHFGQIAPVIPERYRARSMAAQLPGSSPMPGLAADIASAVASAQRTLGTAQQILSIADMGVLAASADGTISEANRNICEIFGYAEGEMLGMSVHQLLPPHFRQRHVELVRHFLDGDETERRMAGRTEVMGYRKDGSFFPLEASIAKVRNGDDWLLVVTMRDVTERKKAEEELTRRATHDPLTGLPNRTLIRERLVNLLLRSQRTGLPVGLLFVDLDGFKLINDTYGHEAGDSVLQTVAARLIELVRRGDMVSRLAGDEFLILCEQVDAPATLNGLADRINERLRQPFEYDGLPMYVSASIGIALGTGDTHSADGLMHHADAAMYAVKEKGRDGWQFFSEALQEQARQRLMITNGLRTAIERNELSPRFQPIVAAESGRIVGAELLLRWKPPMGEVSPAVFIPIAESTGAIVPIGAWVFRAACLAEVDWRQRWGERAPYVSLNLSTRQLSEVSLADDFASILQETGADPARLLLEITESSLMADVDANLRILRRLAEFGLRVAVDDFGTGYSSLAQLTRLPVNVLKIDRAFVDGINKSAESRTVIRAVIGMGRALGLKMVAEGVEDAAQWRELCGYGCDFLQGYYFQRPLEAERFIETVESASGDDPSHETDSLYFLLYVSRAVTPLSAEVLDALCNKAGENNRNLGISGCLVYQDGCFMQMLEGRREHITTVMERIRADERHRDIRIVIEGPAQRRIFPDWGMALRDLEIDNQPDFSGWQGRRIDFLELADDARACYYHVTAYACANSVSDRWSRTQPDPLA